MLSISHQVSFSYFEIFFLKAVDLANRVTKPFVQIKQETQYSANTKECCKNF